MLYNYIIITHADDSRRSKAFSGRCVILYVCVYPHDKTKMAETKAEVSKSQIKSGGREMCTLDTVFSYNC